MDMMEKRLYDEIQGRANLNTIKQLIKEDVDCNLSHFDPITKKFSSPIHLAIKTNKGSTLRLLYKDRNRPTKAHLEKYFALYKHHANPSNEEANEILLDYIISRLLYVRLTEQSQVEIDTLIVALRNYNGVTSFDGKNLCGGSQPEIYLQLRIYTLFRWIIDMKIDFDNFMVNIIVDELLHNLETYYFLDSVLKIPGVTQAMMNKSFSDIKSSHSSLITYYESIAKNVIKKIKQLKIDQEYTIPTGWVDYKASVGHAVCVSFRCISQTYISIRIDNSIPCNPLREHDIVRSPDGSDRIKPKVLGQLHIGDVEKNLDYFVLLIDSVARDLSTEEGVSLIYDHENKILHLDKSLKEMVPSLPIQANANCFVKCFEAGLFIRFGSIHPELYEKFLLQEKNKADLLQTRCKKELEPASSNTFSWFTRFAEDDSIYNLPVTQRMHLQNQLKKSYQQNYQYMLTFTERQSRSFVTEKYVPLRLEKDKLPTELKNIFIEPRVLLVGDAGCGKTTICQYITYSWSKGEIWQNRYEWLFYIKMRNLITNYYPPRSNDYSLIDIIATECFQGFELNDSDKEQLKNYLENSKHILWILDGCDERVIPDYLITIERTLFAQRNLLLTARPYVSDDIKYDIEIDVKGFMPDDIENYIKKYFSPMFRTTATNCWSFIKGSSHLRETAKVPACLQMMCSLWDYSKKVLEPSITMGKLYQKMCEHLLRRYLLKFHKECTRTTPGRSLYRLPNARAFTYLESLAFQATKSHRLTISGEELADIDDSSLLSLLQIGLLISENRTPSPVLTENTYYFVHRSFQEYLCARYMINVLSSNDSIGQQQGIIQFISDEKYDRSLQHTFGLFFDLEPSVECSRQFWSAVASKPRDLVGLRHCSRIIQWSRDGTCGSSGKEKIKNMMTNVVEGWMFNKNRQAHDYANKYIFESFGGAIDELWLKAWREDLSTNKQSRRRYFIPDLWSAKNIKALRRVYDKISNDHVEELHRLIREGPTTRNLQCLNLNPSLFTLHSVRCRMKTKGFLLQTQRKARERQPITTLGEFQSVLRNYAAFAKLNRQTVADGKEIWELKIDPSALENIDHKTLKHLLHLIEKNTLFYRYFELPVVPFLQLYAQQTGQNDDILRKLIVSITFSTKCLITAASDPVKCILVHQLRQNDQFINIRLGEQQWKTLTDAFDIARDSHGYSCFYCNDD